MELGGGGVYSDSYTSEARFLTRWDQHAVAQRQSADYPPLNLEPCEEEEEVILRNLVGGGGGEGEVLSKL